MSLRASPTAIGLFMIGAALLSVVGVASLATSSWRGTESTFVSYFEESVNGLDVGAAVKFQGVPVGRVTDLLIQIGNRDRTFQVPVQYDVDLTRLTSVTGDFVDLSDTLVLREQIDAGLRAQLQMESFVTGQLYIELVYRSAVTAPLVETHPVDFPEIPTSPSLMANFGNSAGNVVNDVLRILIRVEEMLGAIDVAEINRSLVASATAVERLAGSPELQAAIDGVPAMTDQFVATLSGMERLTARLEAAVDPLEGQLAETHAELGETLRAMRLAMDDVRGLISSDSGVGYRMEGALASIQAAADAMRSLAVSLDRNPDMLIRGRKDGGR